MEQKKHKLLIGKDYGTELVRVIGEARASLDIIMFEWRWFENDPGARISQINSAILSARKRGVSVRAIVNYPQQAENLASRGIPSRCVAVQRLMHAKAVIADREVVVIGSHNFTQTALQSNLEFSVLFSDRDFCADFMRIFDTLWLSPH